MVVGRSVDGYECGFPLENALDGRDAMIAVAMNGEPLPLEHGFPARLVVPGLYGYVSATKWLTEIELTRFADFEHYWEQRGWAEKAPIKLQSRIDVPKGLARVAAGSVAVAGVAWAQQVGVGAVEVAIDDGDVAAGRARRRGHDRHLAAMGVPLGRHARPALDQGAGNRQGRQRADERAGRADPRRRHRPPPDRRHRRVAGVRRKVAWRLGHSGRTGPRVPRPLRCRRERTPPMRTRRTRLAAVATVASLGIAVAATRDVGVRVRAIGSVRRPRRWAPAAPTFPARARPRSPGWPTTGRPRLRPTIPTCRRSSAPSTKPGSRPPSIGEGPFTVFVPNNAAFEKIPQNVIDSILADADLLNSILTYHVVSGQAVAPADLVAAGSIETAGGAVLEITQEGDVISINGGEATVVCGGIPVANGYLYIIDTVLQPPSSDVGADGSTSVASSGPDVTAVATPGEGPQGPCARRCPPRAKARSPAWPTIRRRRQREQPGVVDAGRAIEAAGLGDTLNGEGRSRSSRRATRRSRRSRRPTSSRLADTEQLTNILSYHVVEGESLSAADLAAAGHGDHGAGRRADVLRAAGRHAEHQRRGGQRRLLEHRRRQRHRAHHRPGAGAPGGVTPTNPIRPPFGDEPAMCWRCSNVSGTSSGRPWASRTTPPR